MDWSITKLVSRILVLKAVALEVFLRLEVGIPPLAVCVVVDHGNHSHVLPGRLTPRDLVSLAISAEAARVAAPLDGNHIGQQHFVGEVIVRRQEVQNPELEELWFAIHVLQE